MALSDASQRSVLDQVRAYTARGHFECSNGLHSLDQFNISAFAGFPQQIIGLSKDIARTFAQEKPEVVISLAGPSFLFTKHVAKQLRHVTNFAGLLPTAKLREENGLYSLDRRDTTSLGGKRVLLFMGVCVQPKRLVRILESISGHGGKPVGVGVLCARCTRVPSSEVLGVKAYSVFHLPMQAYQPGECPACGRLPLTPVAHI